MELESLITRITEEVITRLDNKSEPLEGPIEVMSQNEGGPYKSLIVLTAEDKNFPDILGQIEKINSVSGQLTIVIAEITAANVDMSSLDQAVGDAKIVLEKDIGCPQDLLAGIDIVYVPDLTLADAAKITQFITDDNTCLRLIVWGLLQGKKTIVSSNTICLSHFSASTITLGARKKIDDIFRELKELGMYIVDLDQLIDTGTSKLNISLVCPVANGGECESCGLCVVKRTDDVNAIINCGADRIAAANGVGEQVSDPKIAGMIDHTLLKPDATVEQIRKLCEEAKMYKFASVCINPTHVALASKLLEGTEVKVCTVIGFPLGASTPTAKAIETRDAIANGAHEIDMVINIGALKSGDDELVRRDIQAVVDAAKGKAIVKVILETALLTDEEKVKACLLAKMAGADFVKTSTGFGPSGATVEDVALMRKTVGPEMGVKAAGGIRSFETAKAMVEAGATRIGASASIAIAKGS